MIFLETIYSDVCLLINEKSINPQKYDYVRSFDTPEPSLGYNILGEVYSTAVDTSPLPAQPPFSSTG
jgi:hypothetical protein